MVVYKAGPRCASSTILLMLSLTKVSDWHSNVASINTPSPITTASNVASINTPSPITTARNKSINTDYYNWKKKPKPTVTSALEATMYSTAIGVKDYFKEYCDATAIHGVRYFAEDSRSQIEKIFWFVAITLSLAGCFILIEKSYQKWDSSPVIVSFAESSSSIWQVPFPSVSICPETKSIQTRFNFTEAYYKYIDSFYSLRDLNSTESLNSTLLDEEVERMQAVALLCDKHVILSGAETLPQNSIDELTQIAPQFEEMVLVCRWNRKVISNCTDYFQPVWSDEGLCYTFNLLDNSEIFRESTIQHGEFSGTGRGSSGWDLENGYSLNEGIQTFPYRTLGAGVDNGLFILLKSNESELDYLCRGPVQGYKIVLHNPVEFPTVKHPYFPLQHNQMVVAKVKPSMMTSSPTLRDYAPKVRQCYFPTERKLRYFKVYTQKNCEMECITNFTLSRCGCVSFFMPKELMLEEFRYDLDRERKATKKIRMCDCLASCVSLDYDAEVTPVDYNWTKVFQAYRTDIHELGPGLLLTRMVIFFKEKEFIATHRSELYGQTDFLANCGGLLGLFSGFSLISLIEIMYFVTLRLWCRLAIRRGVRSASPDVTS